MGLSTVLDPLRLTGLVEPVLKELNISGDYSQYLPIAAVLLVGGLFAPLIGSLLRLTIGIVSETIRVPIRWIRGISNQLAIAIYRHGPLFSRQIARPLALALLIGVGYIVVAESLRGKSNTQTAKKNIQPPVTCSGELVDLTCPRSR